MEKWDAKAEKKGQTISMESVRGKRDTVSTSSINIPMASYLSKSNVQSVFHSCTSDWSIFSSERKWTLVSYLVDVSVVRLGRFEALPHFRKHVQDRRRKQHSS